VHEAQDGREDGHHTGVPETFLLLTWIEELFNIAGPGAPAGTSWMVVGIVSSARVFFLVFERRTFCRYICPLSTLIGTVGSMGSVVGFRTRDREVCLSCQTKDCMRGGEKGYGCSWYTWPGSGTKKWPSFSLSISLMFLGVAIATWPLLWAMENQRKWKRSPAPPAPSR
jgi:hypothetical protein